MRRTQYEIWEDTFKPQENHLAKDRGFDGCLFETFGVELNHVHAVSKEAPERVWTVVEGDNGKWYVSQGWHLVNRVGYLITEEPYNPQDPKQQERYGQKDVLYV